jgi:surface antigen
MRRDGFEVRDWRGRNLPPPPAGYRWYCSSPRNCALVRSRTGIIQRTHVYDEREDYWRRRYERHYTYQDDYYYRECRARPDPAGILIGGLIGGLIGSAAGHHDAGDVFAGVIIGSMAGAIVTRDMDCEDRSYAYRAFHDGLNGWRVGVAYPWQNPRNGHHGEFRVRGYYYDGAGFHCARYRHTTWLARRRVFDGRACRQADGAWAFID